MATFGLRAQCELALHGAREVDGGAHAVMLRAILRRLGQLQDALLDPLFVDVHAPQRRRDPSAERYDWTAGGDGAAGGDIDGAAGGDIDGAAGGVDSTDEPCNSSPDDAAARAHALAKSRKPAAALMPWELAGGHVALIGDLLLGEVATRATNEPVPPELLSVLVRGTPLHANSDEADAIPICGLIHLLEYGESPPERAARRPVGDGIGAADHAGTPDGPLAAGDTPTSRVFAWAAELCAQPEMLVHGHAVEQWAARGMHLLLSDGLAPLGSVRPSINSAVCATLTLGLVAALDEQYRRLAPMGKTVLVAPAFSRTRSLVEMLTSAVRVHDACKALLRACARTATSSALSSAHPLSLFQALEGVVRHPLFMQWPKRFNEDLQSKLRYLRGFVHVLEKLRAHSARTIAALQQANAVLDEQFAAALGACRAALFSDGQDVRAELARRAALNHVAHMTQRLVLTVQRRFRGENREADKLHAESRAHMIPLEVATEIGGGDDASAVSGEAMASSFGDALDEILLCVDEVDGLVADAHVQIDEQVGTYRLERQKSSRGRDPPPAPPASEFRPPPPREHSKSTDMSQAVGMFLELMRSELKPRFEAIFEEAIGELKHIDDDALPSILDVGLQLRAHVTGVGTLADIAEEFAAATGAEAAASSASAPASAAAGAATKAAKALWARRRTGAAASAAPSGRGLGDTPGRSGAASVREVAAWCAVRVAASLKTQLGVAGVRSDWKARMTPVLDALYKAIFTRQVVEADALVRKVLALEPLAAHVNARTKEHGATTTSLMSKMRAGGKMMGMMGGLKAAAAKEEEEIKRRDALSRQMPTFGSAGASAAMPSTSAVAAAARRAAEAADAISDPASGGFHTPRAAAAAATSAAAAAANAAVSAVSAAFNLNERDLDSPYGSTGRRSAPRTRDDGDAYFSAPGAVPALQGMGAYESEPTDAQSYERACRTSAQQLRRTPLDDFPLDGDALAGSPASMKQMQLRTRALTSFDEPSYSAATPAAAAADAAAQHAADLVSSISGFTAWTLPKDGTALGEAPPYEMPPTPGPPTNEEEVDSLKRELLRLRGEHLLLREYVTAQQTLVTNADGETGAALRAHRRAESPNQYQVLVPSPSKSNIKQREGITHLEKLSHHHKQPTLQRNEPWRYEAPRVPWVPRPRDHVSRPTSAIPSPPPSPPGSTPPPSPPPSPPPFAAAPSMSPTSLGSGSLSPPLRKYGTSSAGSLAGAFGGGGSSGGRAHIPKMDNDRRRTLAAAALGELEIELSKLVSILEAQQKAIWHQAGLITNMRKLERSRAGTPASKHPHALHKARGLTATADGTHWLLWMQQELLGCRRLKQSLVQRLQSAWLLVGREKIAAHLLDVLEARLAHIDEHAMQHLIDVEQAWLLGKVATPKRTGGGFARNKSKGAGTESLGNETEHMHNLEVRHLRLDLNQRGPVVPPPATHGLRLGTSPSRSAGTLWPDAQTPTKASPAAKLVSTPFRT